jgi:hypothetical protein
MKTKINKVNATAPQVDLNRLGLCVTVKYLSATNSKGSRWKASLNANGKIYTVIKSFDYGSAIDDGQLSAANACLEKFNKSRCSIHPDLKPLTFSHRAYISPNVYAFFC